MTSAGEMCVIFSHFFAFLDFSTGGLVLRAPIFAPCNVYRTVNIDSDSSAQKAFQSQC